MSEEEYEKLKDPRKRFTSNKKWEKFFTLSDEIRNGITLSDQEKLEKVISEEIKMVRSGKKQKTA